MDSISKLNEIICVAFTVGKKTLSNNLKTAYGLKDCYLEHFTVCAFDALAKMDGSKEDRQKKLDTLRASMPLVITSPIW